MTASICKFRATITFQNELIAGIPALTEGDDEQSRKTAEAWIRKQADGYDITDQDISEMVEKHVLETGFDTGRVFKRTSTGDPALEARQIKAMIREGSQRLGLLKGGKANLGRQHMQHDVEVRSTDGKWLVPIIGGEGPLTGERPVHVKTPMGPRSSISMYEYMDCNPQISFDVTVLKGVAAKPLDFNLLKEIIETTGLFMGLGADRSMGFGRFELESLVEV